MKAAGAMISLVIFIVIFISPASAVTMHGSQYVIESDINSSGRKSTETSGKIGTNYKVRAGFQYVKSIMPFTFSISTTNINFGTLVPGEPVTRDNTLTVSHGSAPGYQVNLEKNHPLRISSTNIDIPDTTCEAGNCSHTQPGAWTSLLTYGFGYRCDNLSGTDCDPGFTTSRDYFKQFPTAETNESSQVVMSSTNASIKPTAKISYKVNISASQARGIYQNIIKYIATPSI